MTTAFERAAALTPAGPRRRKGHIDESWHQGRGGFGGLLAATALAAMTEDVGDPERAPRSLTVHFCAPATGTFELVTEVVRAGSRVSHATARIETGGSVATIASASFCKDRAIARSYLDADVKMPSVPAASTLAPLPSGIPGLPAFFQHVDARFCGATKPFTSAKEAKVAAWVQLREPLPLTAQLAAFLLDTLPAAMAATLDRPRPLASVDFNVKLLARFPLEGAAINDYYLVATRAGWADAGYTVEVRDLWSPRGELIAQCHQLIALL